MAKSRKKKSQSTLMRGLVGLVYGYFFTYILGTMILELGIITQITLLQTLGNMLLGMKMVGIAVGVAAAIQASSMALLSSVIIGLSFQNNMLMIYIMVIVCFWIGDAIYGKTPFDLFLIPLISLILCQLVLIFIMPSIDAFRIWLTQQLTLVSNYSPLIKHLLVPVLSMFIAILPLDIEVVLSGYTGMIAWISTLSLMLSLGLMSYKNNSLGDVLGMTFGTPMLQLTNILRHPMLLLPSMISSMITSALATMVFHLEASGSYVMEGMMGLARCASQNGMHTWPILILLLFISGAISMGVFQVMTRRRWIESRDLVMEKL